MAMRDQWVTSRMFDARVWWGRDVFTGRFDILPHMAAPFAAVRISLRKLLFALCSAITP